MEPSLRSQLLHTILLAYEDSFPLLMKMYYQDQVQPDNLVLYMDAICYDDLTGHAIFEPEVFLLPFDADLPIDMAMALFRHMPIQLHIKGVMIEFRTRTWAKAIQSKNKEMNLLIP